MLQLRILGLTLCFALPALAGEGNPTLDLEMVAYDCNRALDPKIENLSEIAMVASLSKQVIGQPLAVEQIVKAISRVKSGLQNPEKPLLTILELGPSGTGKTELPKALIKELGGNADLNLVRVDGAELQGDGSITRLIGTTAGHVGYGQKPQLHSTKLQTAELELKLPDGSVKKILVVLFDEIEKAHKSAWLLFLKALDEGRMTMADGTVSHFTNTIFIGTSNIGAKEVKQVIETARAKFKGDPKDFDPTGRSNPELREQILEATKQAVGVYFKDYPEFLLRWNHVVQFLHLGPDELFKISQKKLAAFQNTLLNQAALPVGLKIAPEVRNFLIERGTSFENGARPLDPLINEKFVDGLANMISANHIEAYEVIEVTLQGEELAWHAIGKYKDRAGLLEFAKKEYPGYSMEPRTVVKSQAAGQSAVSEQERLKKFYESIDEFEETLPVENSAEGETTYQKAKYARISSKGVTQLCRITYNEGTGQFALEPIRHLPPGPALLYNESSLQVYKLD